MKAFTYLLIHLPTGKRYYGVRFAKGAHPDQLWTTYFSTSKIVKQLIAETGVSSFTAEVRRTFDDPLKALAWETKFLHRIDATRREDWLNRHNGGKKFRAPETHSPETRAKLSRSLTGRKCSDEQRRKQSEKAKLREQARRETGWKMPPESTQQGLSTRKAKIAAGEINPYSEDRNKKMGETKRGTYRVYRSDGSYFYAKP